MIDNEDALNGTATASEGAPPLQYVGARSLELGLVASVSTPDPSGACIPPFWLRMPETPPDTIQEAVEEGDVALGHQRATGVRARVSHGLSSGFTWRTAGRG
jgi:hypothetical protein